MIRLRWPALLLVLFFLSGCVRRTGRNADCQWPHTPPSVSQRDLGADLEFAEDLAIRYMDAHYGPRDPAAAAQAKNRCLSLMLEEIGKEHGMTAEKAFRSFGKRSAAVDLTMNFPFILLYILAANFAIRRVLQRYPPSEGLMGSIIIMMLASVAFGAIGVVLGQQWSSMAESIRVGSTHLSNRALRLPISKHPSEAFIFATALFGAMATLRYWTEHKAPTAGL
jgi:hypothetical protein